MIKSKNPGPRVCIVAGIHGDEVGGIEVAKRIQEILKKELISGEVHIIPIANAQGFRKKSRFIEVNEKSKEDLNRCFPGDKNGSLGNKLAYELFTKIISLKPNLVLDLHNDWKYSIPYTLLDKKNTDNQTYEKTKLISFQTGFPVILDTDNMEKTLTYNILKKNIPTIAIELGESDIINEKNISQGINSILNILIHMKMIKTRKIKNKLNKQLKNKVLIYSQGPKSKTSGNIKFLVKPGQTIKKNKVIAKVYKSNKLIEIIRSTNKSLVIGHTDNKLISPKEQLIALGVIK